MKPGGLKLELIPEERKQHLKEDLARADMVDVGEFPHLGQKCSVMGVPKTVINEKMEFVGAVLEEHFVRQVLLAQRPTSMYV